MEALVRDVVWLNLPFFLLGLFIIIRGSDLFLDNAVWIARASGVPQLIIGATIVSLCTTLPEVVSSCAASLRGAADMAVGNAVGSIICNTGLIMGVMLLFITAVVRREVFLIKGTFMIGALMSGACLMWPAATPAVLEVSRSEGLCLLVLLAIFLVVNYYESLHVEADDTAPVMTSEERARDYSVRQWVKRMGIFVAGGISVAIGAYLLVAFGQRLARNMGISEAVISLLFVALGTSLPELFTAITAVRKKAEQISVGNIFGANVLNMALVMGASATLRPLTVGDHLLLRFDIPVAMLLCLIPFGVGIYKGRIGRGTGIALISLYIAYIASMFVMKRIG